ncbi:MAG: nitroreductase family deazaflavin-dependent oxidoreductase [Chloroflexota bacterium]
MGWLAAVGAGFIAILAVVIGTYFVGMRFKLGFAQRAVIAFTKHVVNPQMRKTAGQAGAGAAIIRNVGRSSGRVYETPVGAEPIDGGFVIALPYGSRPNWLRNVLAAGGATLVHQGAEYRVDRPELVPLEPMASAFSASDQKLHRMFHVDEALRVRVVADEAGAAAA